MRNGGEIAGEGGERRITGRKGQWILDIFVCKGQGRGNFAEGREAHQAGPEQYFDFHAVQEINYGFVARHLWRKRRTLKTFPLEEDDSSFEDWLLFIHLVAVVVACNAVAGRGKEVQFFAQPIFYINSALKRVHAFWCGGILILKILDMEITEVAAQFQFGQQLVEETGTIEEAAREFVVEVEVVRAEAHGRIGEAVLEAHRYIGLARVATIEKQLDARAGRDIHQSYLVGSGVLAMVDDANLHPFHVSGTEVEKSDLYAPHRSGIVARSQLHSFEIALTDVRDARELQRLVCRDGDIRCPAQLHTREALDGIVADASLLEPFDAYADIADCRQLQAIDISTGKVHDAGEVHPTGVVAGDVGNARNLDTGKLVVGDVHQTAQHATIGIVACDIGDAADL